MKFETPRSFQITKRVHVLLRKVVDFYCEHPEDSEGILFVGPGEVNFVKTHRKWSAGEVGFI